MVCVATYVGLLVYFLGFFSSYVFCLSFDVPEYIVKLRTSETIENLISYDNTISVTQRLMPLIKKRFSFGEFTGFSGPLTNEILSRLSNCPLVAEITPDIIIRALDFEVQDNAPRHLARLSQRSSLDDPPFRYVYDNNARGQGVTAYVIDSGLSLDHPEFEGRAEHGTDFTGEGSGDFNGHGTHVAGVIGSKTYGVSKGVNILEIKALDRHGTGSLSTIIAALEYVVNHRQSVDRPGVVNLSLGAMRNSILNQAINAAVDSGLVVVVAAGNSNINACSTSPASASSAITVGAIDDRDDSYTSFTNWGECVNIFASGAYVSSVSSESLWSPRILSGTSMSSPIVAGLIANLLSQGIPAAKIKSTVQNLATDDAINRSRKSLFNLRPFTPNRLAFNGVFQDHDESDEREEKDDYEETGE